MQSRALCLAQANGDACRVAGRRSMRRACGCAADLLPRSFAQRRHASERGALRIVRPANRRGNSAHSLRSAGL